MSGEQYDWVPRRPSKTGRAIAGVLVLCFVVPIISRLAGWRLFGDYDKMVAVIAGAVLLVFFCFMPGVRRRP